VASSPSSAEGFLRSTRVARCEPAHGVPSSSLVFDRARALVGSTAREKESP